jgi:hypothetical protein
MASVSPSRPLVVSAISNPKGVKKFFKNLRSYVNRYLTEGVNRKMFPAERTKDLPAIVIALGMGLGIMWTVDPEAFDLNEIGKTYQEVIRKFIES